MASFEPGTAPKAWPYIVLGGDREYNTMGIWALNVTTEEGVLKLVRAMAGNNVYVEDILGRPGEAAINFPLMCVFVMLWLSELPRQGVRTMCTGSAYAVGACRLPPALVINPRQSTPCTPAVNQVGRGTSATYAQVALPLVPGTKAHLVHTCCGEITWPTPKKISNNVQLISESGIDASWVSSAGREVTVWVTQTHGEKKGPLAGATAYVYWVHDLVGVGADEVLLAWKWCMVSFWSDWKYIGVWWVRSCAGTCMLNALWWAMPHACWFSGAPFPYPALPLRSPTASAPSPSSPPAPLARTAPAPLTSTRCCPTRSGCWRPRPFWPHTALPHSCLQDQQPRLPP